MTVSAEGSFDADNPRLAVSLYTHQKVRVLKLALNETSFLVFAFLEYRGDNEPPRAITRNYLEEKGTFSSLRLPAVLQYGESKEVNNAATRYFYEQQVMDPGYVLQQIARKLWRLDPKGHLEQAPLNVIP